MLHFIFLQRHEEASSTDVVFLCDDVNNEKFDVKCYSRFESA